MRSCQTHISPTEDININHSPVVAVTAEWVPRTWTLCCSSCLVYLLRILLRILTLNIKDIISQPTSMHIINIDFWEASSVVHFHWRTVVLIILLVHTTCACLSPQVLMLRMVSNQVSSHDCNATAVSSNHISSRDVQLDCNFFLTAIRLASLNQILDPWVYLLLREILLRKFCIVANAVSNCSIELQKETQTALDALNKPKQDSINLQKLECS